MDGALVDLYHLPHGYWEAKDEKDDLAREVERKLDKGYPRDNIIFQAPERAILYQSGARIFDENITRPEALVSVVNQFFDYKAPHIQEWEEAVRDFSERIPELAAAVTKTIDEEKKRNPAFVRSFKDFYALCKQAINPNLSEEAVERMLVQHLLTERIFRKIFDNPDFTRRNVVAAEIEKVVAELTKRSLNRDDFLRNLERFYRAIERSAEETTNFSEKQAFLNKVYERFFQGYSPKEADTHGIVYTPQPIVNFMVRSVEEILQKEFGRSLGDKGVHILDPFVGTGNFIVRMMQEIKTTDLPYKYENELHCNEVMLLPYYIASMNIEHAYFDRVGEYKPFPGICLVDTFDMRAQSTFFTEAKTTRIEAQSRQEIFVVIGNPPYNAWQVNENDNNKNRKYEALNERISETYAKSSRATNKSALSDPYVKAIRWASDRIKQEGVVAFVTNSGFLEALAADGMRMHLSRDFDEVYIVDLGGNVRKNPKLSGTTHNVFGIQVGVSINLFVRHNVAAEDRQCRIRYASADEFWTRTRKYAWLDGLRAASGVEWTVIKPDGRNNWLQRSGSADFGSLVPLASEENADAVFATISNGVQTNRDAWVYNFSRGELSKNVERLSALYNQQVREWKDRGSDPKELDSFVDADDMHIKWSSRLKERLLLGRTVSFTGQRVRSALYRPFCKQFMYFDDTLVHRPGQFPRILPGPDSGNLLIWLKIGGDWPFFALTSNVITDQLPQGGSQCFPFYTYAEDGTNRRGNITDWALEQFRARYGDRSISKWDIFHYIYAVLHHPEYRQRYAANLRRELPRIPFVSATPGAKAQVEGAPNAALKHRSSTVTSSRSSTVTSSRPSTVTSSSSMLTSSNDGVRVGASVEERPFRAASEQEDSRALAPVPSDLDVFHAFARASRKSTSTTSNSQNIR